MLILICIIIWVRFGYSLEHIQYYYHRLLNDHELFNHKHFELYMLGCTAISGIIYNHYHNYNQQINKTILRLNNNKIHFIETHENNIVGYIVQYKKSYIISMISTINLDDIITSTQNDLVDIIHGRVHRGYLTRIKNCYQNVLNILQNSSVNEIYITGHSMGGALGCLLGYYIHQHIPDLIINIYTFGSPRYGDLYLKYYIEHEHNINIINYINEADPVVYKPLNYEYVSIGKVNKWKIDTGNDNVNHGIKVYKECVQQLKSSKIKRRTHRIDELLARSLLDILG